MSLFGQTQNKPLFGQTGTAAGTGNTSAFGGFGGTATSNPQPAAQPGGGLFGGSANTGTGSTGLFGQQNPNQSTTAPAAGGTGIFGQSTANNAGAANSGGTGLFGGTNTANPANTNTTGGGGLFGSSTNTAAAPAAGAGGGLFGSSNTTGGGTGLFGQAKPAGGGLFGSQPQQQQPAGAGGLFGSSTTQPQQPASGTSGGLFGTSTTQPAATGTGTGLFGSTTTNAQTGGGTGLFGSTTSQQPQQQSGLFSGSTFGQPKPPTTTTFGQPAQQQQQQQQVTSTQGLFTKTTKFNDIPDDLKRVLEGIESHISGRVQISKDLKARKLGEETRAGQTLVKTVHHDLITTMNQTKADLGVAKDLKEKTDLAVQDTINATRIIEAVRNPQANGHWALENAGFPLEYFTRVTESLTDRLRWCKGAIEQIERKLATLSSGQRGHGLTPQSIVSTLQMHQAALQALAGKLAALNEELNKIKPIYTRLWQERSQSARDPFEHSPGLDT